MVAYLIKQQQNDRQYDRRNDRQNFISRMQVSKLDCPYLVWSIESFFLIANVRLNFKLDFE